MILIRNNGCPGGNVENAVDEMKRTGAEAINLATEAIVLV